MNEFAIKLKGYVKGSKKSQGALARESGISTTHISNILNGRRLPTATSLGKIAVAMKLSKAQRDKLVSALARTRYP